MNVVEEHYFSELISQIFHFWRGFVFLIFWVFDNLFVVVVVLLFTSHTIHNPVLHFYPKSFSFFLTFFFSFIFSVV